MKKSMIALAALGAFAGTAMAQNTVTLYGTIDPGLASTKVTTIASGTETSVSNLGAFNNGRGTSQVSVKGSVDAGAGLQGIFLWEGDMNVGSGGKDLLHALGGQGGEVYAGLAGGFGSIKIGTPNTPTLYTQLWRQPFTTKIGGGFGGVLGTGHVRNNGSVVYGSPALGPVSVSVGFTPAVKSATATTAGATTDIGVNGQFGPVKAGVSFYNVGAPTGGYKNSQTNLYAQIGAGPATVFLGYAAEKMPNAAADKQTSMNAGVNVGLGGGLSLQANAGKLNDKSTGNKDKSILGLGLEVALGKQTTVYGRFVNEKNSNVTAGTTKVNTLLVGTQVNF